MSSGCLTGLCEVWGCPAAALSLLKELKLNVTLQLELQNSILNVSSFKVRAFFFLPETINSYFQQFLCNSGVTCVPGLKDKRPLCEYVLILKAGVLLWTVSLGCLLSCWAAAFMSPLAFWKTVSISFILSLSSLWVSFHLVVKNVHI